MADRRGLGARADPWAQVAVLAAMGAAATVAAVAWVDGVVADQYWIAAIGGLLVAGCATYPVGVTRGPSGRHYMELSEVGIGVVVVTASPAAVAMVVAGAQMVAMFSAPTAWWKRLFGVSQPCLAAILAALVMSRLGSEGVVEVASVVAGGAVHALVCAVMLGAMVLALGDPALRASVVRTFPVSLAASIAAIAGGVTLGVALDAGGQSAVLGLLGVIGFLALVRIAHANAMRADRLQTLFAASAGLGRSGPRTSFEQVLDELGPELVPGASRLRLTDHAPPSGSIAVEVPGRGWLVADRGGAADPAKGEDLAHLRLLASVLNDVMAHSQQMSEAEQQAMTDPLTGALNRRGIEAEATKLDEPCSVVAIDLRGFKAINDVHGHHVGDVALETLARTLREGLRHGDLVGRPGGDEFVVVARGLAPGAADELVDRLVRTTNEKGVLPEGAVVRATLGVATWDPTSGEPLDVALQRADKAMYQRRSEDQHGRSGRPAT